METINFGIDLGTTNSLIAKFEDGSVEIYKNPLGLKESIPSCVAFRGERIIVGDKAREWLLKDPMNVFASFKRKMGTDENYYITSQNDTISPIALSAHVLKEMKNFVHTGEVPQAVVITIPASFDTIQSNATKQAGYEAGFKEVALLQEPIAASLAFFNKHLSESKEKGKWLVYDLGGGTFDIALVGIENNEMKVIDHKGDNYLGGVDFDHLIVMDVIVPKLIRLTGNMQMTEQIKSRQKVFEKLYFVLLLKAEEAKKELSSSAFTEVEVEYELENGNVEDFVIEVTRDELNAVIADKIQGTIAMILDILERNNLTKNEIEELIMIGGSTYIPYVRESVAAETGIVINTKADPTTAVVVGAAYFAGNKPKQREAEVKPKENTEDSGAIGLKFGYNKTTKDSEEYVSLSVTNFKSGCFYRISREDGGFDSALKALTPTFGEFLLVLPNRKNVFNIRLFDEFSTPLDAVFSPIEITHGLFNLYGQPLPEDICIEVDDLSNNATKCEVVFARNSILPLTKTLYKEISKTIRKNSDDVIFINLLEGDGGQHPSTNKVIGVIEIKAEFLTNDIIKGSEVELLVEMSESRDIKVSLLLGMTNQSFNEVFSPTKRYVSALKLQDEISELRGQLRLDLDKALRNEEFEFAAQIQTKIDKVQHLYEQAKSIRNEGLTDEKYQIDEAKRKLAQQLYASGSSNTKVYRIKERIYETVELLQSWIETFQDIPDRFKEGIKELMENKHQVAKSNNYFIVEGQNAKANKLVNNVILYTPTLLISYFHIYASLSPQEYSDYRRAQTEIAKGEKAIERQNYEELRGILLSLSSLSKSDEPLEVKIKGTGLS
jgi:molecular chaperone DnaK